MDRFKNYFKKVNPFHWKILAIFAVFAFFLIVAILYSRGYIILGGEGNYFTNYELVRKYGSFAWSPLMNGTGSSNPILNMLIPVFDVLSWLQKAGMPFKAINVLLISSVYSFSFLSMFWMEKNALKLKFSVSFLVSLLYVVNPFSTYHLNGMMFWNSAPLFMLPLSFGLLYKYYYDKSKSFLYFGLVTSFFAFSFENPPYLALFHVFIPISALIIVYMKENKINLLSSLKYFFVIEASFFLFNSWWLINSMRFYLQETSDSGLKNVSLSWAKAYILDGQKGIIHDIFSLRTLLGPGADSFFSAFYFNFFVILVSAVPFIALILLLFKNKKRQNKVPLAIFIFLLLVIFLNKGAFPPLGNIYQFFIKYIPLFELFKTPLEKFSVLFTFLFCLNLALALDLAKNKLYAGAISACVLVFLFPYFSLNFIPDFKVGENIYISRKFINKKEYTDSESLINSEKLNYRYLSLPGSKNYQVTMANHENKYYRGMDPVLFAMNKGFIAAYSGDYDLIYKNLSESNLENILSIYNIKKIIVNEDIYPAYGFEEKEEPGKLNEIFSQNMEKVKNGPVKIYTTNKFLPLIYAPEQVVVSQRQPEEISRILLHPEFNVRSALFFSQANNPETLQKLSGLESGGNISPPSVEYKKINPIKFRIRVHKAKGPFPLVFSEAFHKGWKLYLVKSLNYRSAPRNLDNYRIFGGNDSGQATKDELSGYIKNRLVTALGDGTQKERVEEKSGFSQESKENSQEKYTIDFISKNFYGTIQNDNLPNGKIWESWFKDPASDGENHLTANGYANSWVVNAEDLCAGNSLCTRNADGSYDFELVMEFWPQRIFYVGIMISLLSVWITSGYVIYNWKKRKYVKK